jgi:hypothetical protein
VRNDVVGHGFAAVKRPASVPSPSRQVKARSAPQTPLTPI